MPIYCSFRGALTIQPGIHPIWHSKRSAKEILTLKALYMEILMLNSGFNYNLAAKIADGSGGRTLQIFLLEQD
jgi:hypothetical protein